jgi:hypothetical protein
MWVELDDGTIADVSRGASRYATSYHASAALHAVQLAIDKAREDQCPACHAAFKGGTPAANIHNHDLRPDPECACGKPRHHNGPCGTTVSSTKRNSI